MTQVMTRISRRAVEVGRIRIQFFVKHTVEQTPTQPLANAFAPLRVSTPEATAFDLIRYAARIGGIAAVETLSYAHHKIMWRQLVAVQAEPFPNHALHIIARIGALGGFFADYKPQACMLKAVVFRL